MNLVLFLQGPEHNGILRLLSKYSQPSRRHVPQLLHSPDGRNPVCSCHHVPNLQVSHTRICANQKSNKSITPSSGTERSLQWLPFCHQRQWNYQRETFHHSHRWCRLPGWLDFCVHTLETSIKHRSDTFALDRSPIKFDPLVFVIYGCEQMRYVYIYIFIYGSCCAHTTMKAGQALPDTTQSSIPWPFGKAIWSLLWVRWRKRAEDSESAHTEKNAVVITFRASLMTFNNFLDWRYCHRIHIFSGWVADGHYVSSTYLAVSSA